MGHASGALDRDWATGSPATGVPADGWSALFAGTITLPSTGTYEFWFDTDGGVRLYLDDELIGDEWAFGGGTTTHRSVTGAAAGKHRIQVEYFDAAGSASLTLRWSGPGVSGVVPGDKLSPEYGLLTSTVDPDGRKNGTEYSASGIGPELGLVTATVTDPDTGGLRLRSETEYSDP
ncbi:MAG: PA14 domain-containing protein, partial [Acidimicrobiia bacterium]